MVLAAVNDNLYRVLFLLHILAVVVAFAPAVINPVLAARAKADGEDVLTRVGGYMAANGRQIHFPALVLVGLFGLGMAFSSDSVWEFDQLWLQLAILDWIAICGVVSAVILPAERKVGAGDLSAEPRVAMGGQVVTVLALAMLYLMIWKPGL